MSDIFFENTAVTPRPVWVSLNWVLAGFISLIILMTLAMRYLPETSRRDEMWAQIQDLEATLEQKRAILQRNERQEKLLRTSSEYLSMKARDRLDLMQEGETLYRFEAPQKR